LSAVDGDGVHVTLREYLQLWILEHQRAHDLEAKNAQDKYEKLNELREEVTTDRNQFCTKEHADIVRETAREAKEAAEAAGSRVGRVEALIYAMAVGLTVTFLGMVAAVVLELMRKM